MWRLQACQSHTYLTYISYVIRRIKSFRDLTVYQGGLDLVMEMSDLCRRLPADEKYVLGDQIRRSSRSVCANIAEAWRKRRYLAAFISKLNDSETEAAETQVHLDVAIRHNYITQQFYERLDDSYDKIIAQLTLMIEQAPNWTIKPRKEDSERKA
jgi:four helix bundle protein